MAHREGAYLKLFNQKMTGGHGDSFFLQSQKRQTLHYVIEGRYAIAAVLLLWKILADIHLARRKVMRLSDMKPTSEKKSLDR